MQCEHIHSGAYSRLTHLISIIGVFVRYGDKEQDAEAALAKSQSALQLSAEGWTNGPLVFTPQQTEDFGRVAVAALDFVAAGT